MIPFFKKLRKQLANDNKPLKYLRYAIGEIVLVVIGILIALSINNWNEYRKERIKEKEVLEALKTNLERNSDLLKDIISKIDQWDRSTEIVKYAIENRLPYSDTLAVHFGDANKNGAYQVILNYDGYKFYENAGFDIIRNKTLKGKVLSLFEVSYLNVRNLIDYLKSPWNISAQSFYSNFYVLRNKVVSINYDELLSNKKYLTSINANQYNRNSFKTAVKASLVETQNVIQLINDELKKN